MATTVKSKRCLKFNSANVLLKNLGLETQFLLKNIYLTALSSLEYSLILSYVQSVSPCLAQGVRHDLLDLL